VGVEAMGINPEWMGYLRFCAEFGVGRYDLAKIDIRGEKLEPCRPRVRAPKLVTPTAPAVPAAGPVRRKYLLHQDIGRELQWKLLRPPRRPQAGVISAVRKAKTAIRAAKTPGCPLGPAHRRAQGPDECVPRRASSPPNTVSSHRRADASVSPMVLKNGLVTPTAAVNSRTPRAAASGVGSSAPNVQYFALYSNQEEKTDESKLEGSDSRQVS